MMELGIAGLGGWGQNLVKAVQGKSEAVRFTVAASRTPAKVDGFCREHDIRLDQDLSIVLDNPDVKGVVVAGPAQLHAEVAQAVLESGKHVMVIKPLALYRKDAEALSRLAEERNLVLAMGYDRCFLPAVDELRKHVRAGDLGEIVHAEGNFCVDRFYSVPAGDWKSNDAYSQPGSLADHMLYQMIELIGPVDKLFVHAAHRAAPVDMTDTAAVSLLFKNGVSGSLTAIGVTPVFQRLHIFGTEGWVEVRNNRRFEFAPLKGDNKVIDFPAFDALTCQLESFAAAIRGDAPYPVTPEGAVAGVAALEAMGRSAVSGKMETV